MCIHGPALTHTSCFVLTQDGAALQAFVAQLQSRVVGVLILRDEQVGAVHGSLSPDGPQRVGLESVVVFRLISCSIELVSISV